MQTRSKAFGGRGRRFNRLKVGVLVLAMLVLVPVGLVTMWVLSAGDSLDIAGVGFVGADGVTKDPATPPPKEAVDAAEVPSNPFSIRGTRPSAKASYNEVVKSSDGEESIITHAICDDVEMRFPLITFRDRREAPPGHTPSDWQSRHMPLERFRMPTWATVKERNTLRHASIFISIASFRDHECATTLESALTNAASPHRIYAGISEERRPTDVNCLAQLQLRAGGGGFGGEDGSVTAAAEGVYAGDGGTAPPTTIAAPPAPDGEAKNVKDAAVARRLLYGAAAPAGLVVKTRTLRWMDILVDPVTKQPNNISIAAAQAAYGQFGDGSASRAVPPGVYMEDSFMTDDRITCVYSDLDVERDRLTLDPAVALHEAVAARQRKGSRGGPQEHPSEALRGCRVTSRATPERSARGPTFGRYVTSLFYSHQDYYMVVDSHSRFPVDWDLKMIARVFQMPTRGVMSHYPNGYTPENPLKEYNQGSTMSMCRGVILRNGMPKLGARWMSITDAPVVDAFAAAGYMFGDAQFVLDTPFDPFLPYLFDGEEVLYSARLWTSGWDLYAPGQPNIFHHYLRTNTPKFWSLVKMEETRQRVNSERRAIFLLQRSHPWLEVVARRGLNLSLASRVPYIPPERRRIVSEDTANRLPSIGIERVYYGMGTARQLDDYWMHTQLTDDFIKGKDKENRWEGGSGLCDKLS